MSCDLGEHVVQLEVHQWAIQDTLGNILMRGQKSLLNIARTAKGLSYEEEVILQLQSWAKMAGAEIHHVGGDISPAIYSSRSFETRLLEMTFQSSSRFEIANLLSAGRGFPTRLLGP